MIKPYFYKQIDRRWANYTIKNSSGYVRMGSSACGPVTVCNLVCGLKGSIIKPRKMFYNYVKKGWCLRGIGSYWSSMINGPALYGVKMKQTRSKSEVKKALQKNQFVIMLMGPGLWTRGGHYILAYYCTSDGHVYISDPSSSASYRAKNTFERMWRESKNSWICTNMGDFKPMQKERKTSTVKLTHYTNNGRANVREKASGKSTLVGTLLENVKLTVQATTVDDWYKIASGKYKGKYIHNVNLSTYKGIKATYKVTAKVLNIREGWSTDSKVKGTVKRGQVINTTRQRGNWVYAPALKGWLKVSSTYLSKA